MPLVFTCDSNVVSYINLFRIDADMIGMLTSIEDIQTIDYKGATVPFRNIEICTAEYPLIDISFILLATFIQMLCLIL